MTSRRRGAGSLRERRAGVWEIRVALGADAVSGRSQVRSLTVHGDRGDAERVRDQQAAAARLVRERRHAGLRLSVAQLPAIWLDAAHGWKPSTVVGYRSVARALGADSLAFSAVGALRPRRVQAAAAAWEAAGVGAATVAVRVRVLRAMTRWAYLEGILPSDPLEAMPAPAPAGTRLHVTVDIVRELLAGSAALVDAAGRVYAANPSRVQLARLHRLEQLRLLVRLAADTGARRGELAALQLGDLEGAVLSIVRAASAEQIGPTKTGRSRRLTLGAGTIDLWARTVETWAGRQELRGPWVFSADLGHVQRLRADTLGHWFTRLTADLGHPDVTLHRLRHTVATTLVSRGDLLAAQYRLGHRDPSTTLRIYSHALPLHDQDTAALLDALWR